MAFNSMIRQAGNRSRMIQPLPDIGQGQSTPPPGSQAGPMPTSLAPSSLAGQTSFPPPPTSSPLTGPTSGGLTPSGGSPMQAPRVQASTFTMHPPGAPADPNQYNYEPQPDGSWRVYPPGVSAPAHTASASLPRAASTGDYIRMSNAFRMAAPAAGASPQPTQQLAPVVPPPGYPQ